MRDKAQDWLTKKLNISLPYVSMGKVDSLDLWGPNELIILAFYEHNKARYKNVLDIGANLGLHSIMMAKHGWHIKAFEPDKAILDQSISNVIRSIPVFGTGGPSYQPFNAAVSDRDGEANFVRVLQNLTGSHIEGSKDSYGPRETIQVQVMDCKPLFDWADLAKLDVEGHEGILLRSVTAEHLEHLDLICELRGTDEAASVLKHFQDLDCPIYTQKNGWKPATSLQDMPTRHQEGSIFIGKRGGPWT